MPVGLVEVMLTPHEIAEFAFSPVYFKDQTAFIHGYDLAWWSTKVGKYDFVLDRDLPMLKALITILLQRHSHRPIDSIVIQ